MDECKPLHIGSTSLAALGPNTAVFQIVFQLFSFLSITTTGMVARACAVGDNETVRRALANSMILALVFGGITCLGLNLFSSQAGAYTRSLLSST